MHPSRDAAVRLSVSIVLFDTPLPRLLRVLEDLAQAAQSARCSGSLGAAEVEVIDHSPDAGPDCETARALVRWAGNQALQMHYRPQLANRGFGAGHNLAIRAAQSDYHLVLNPDVEMAADALARGLEVMAREPSIALLSPYVTGPDGAQQFLCKRYPSVAVLLLRGLPPSWQRRFAARLARYEARDLCGAQDAVDVQIASGCCMLARTATLRAIDGFDEKFFLYFEDFDLSLRLAAQGRLVYCPQMRIVHHGGFAARKGWRHIRYFVASGVKFFNRHGWRLV